jgi:predicted MFS family arabinose efflux permease
LKTDRYKKYLLALMAIILACNYVDRLALSLVLQDIKVDFNLSDPQLGLLTGIAFALFYSIMGIPIARWADRGNRVSIVSLTTGLWCAAVVTCSLAGSFFQLLLSRIAVAVGEAGCIPTAHSLIADTFTRAERPRAVARYMLGSPLSILIGYFLAGWLNQVYGWRTTFVILGLPGIALALLARFTLIEPRRQADSAVAASAGPALKEVCKTLWTNRTFRHLLFFFSVVYFFHYGIQQWQPAFFIRSYGLQTRELGAWLAAIFGLGGLTGTYLGGELAARFAVQNEKLQLRAMTFVYSSFGIVSAFVYLSSNRYVAFGLMALASVGGATVAGPLFATVQTLVPERMRAVAVAVIYLFANLIGMGLGPFVAGVLSDAFRPWAGDESLRYALLALCPGYLWAGWHLWCASGTIASDLSVSRQQSSVQHMMKSVVN